MKVLIIIASFVGFVACQTAGQTCKNDAACGPTMCCKSSGFGRKRFVFGDSHSTGTCHAYGESGDRCSPLGLHFDIFNHDLHSVCPCSTGLECHGDKETHSGHSHSYTNPHCTSGGAPTGAATTQAPGSTPDSISVNIGP